MTADIHYHLGNAALFDRIRVNKTGDRRRLLVVRCRPTSPAADVRILHPARGTGGRPARWAEVAAWSGRTMHRLVQFHAITRPAAPAPTDPAPWDGQPPPDGDLPAELLGSLCATLAGHTSTPHPCWFCLWDGDGWRQPPSSAGQPRWRLLPAVTQPVLAARSCLVRRLRDRCGNENLALASLAEGGLTRCDLQLAGRILELNQRAARLTDRRLEVSWWRGKIGTSSPAGSQASAPTVGTGW